ncbi:sulfotransferase [Pelagibius litoralis]|uniref:Sulfotransferase n=1 Tax=Pelagibius litoralis TaxID=374515 RepID=A0A967EUG8_9PROT|nr:sulfotransferase [Pelagibius litoralis]NIA66977.1 sulfotransferase [Pelagibius litoralis]
MKSLVQGSGRKARIPAASVAPVRYMLEFGKIWFFFRLRVTISGRQYLCVSTGPFKLVFVAGAMRSGTSLLQHILCSSPQANPFVHGCRYLTSHIGVYAQYAGSDQLFINDYLGGQQELLAFTRDIIDRLLAETHRRLDRPACLVLKNPELSSYFQHAATLLPNARFVISVRDPKDTIASMIRVGEKHRQAGERSFLADVGRDIERLCASYRQFYLPVLRSLKEDRHDLRNRVFFVSYEALIGDTENVLNQLSAFCDLSFPPGKPGDKEGWRSRIDPENDGIFQHTRWNAYLTDLSGGPISASSIGRYRQVLTGDEAEKIDQICTDIRRAFGYATA